LIDAGNTFPRENRMRKKFSNLYELSWSEKCEIMLEEICNSQ